MTLKTCERLKDAKQKKKITRTKCIHEKNTTQKSSSIFLRTKSSGRSSKFTKIHPFYSKIFKTTKMTTPHSNESTT